MQGADAGLEDVGLVVDRHHDLHDRVRPVVDGRPAGADRPGRDRRRRAAARTRSWSPSAGAPTSRPPRRQLRVCCESGRSASTPVGRRTVTTAPPSGGPFARLDRSVVGVDHGGHDGQAEPGALGARSAGRPGPGRRAGTGRRPTRARWSGNPGPSSATSIRAPSAPGRDTVTSTRPRAKVRALATRFPSTCSKPLAVGVDEHVVADHRRDAAARCRGGPPRPRPGAAGSRRGGAAGARRGPGGPARGGPRPAPSAAPPPGRRRRRTGGPPRSTAGAALGQRQLRQLHLARARP